MKRLGRSGGAMSKNKAIRMPFKFSGICLDEKHGDWFAIGTKKAYFEFRITPTGFIRLGKVKTEKHPYFTMNEEVR